MSFLHNGLKRDNDVLVILRTLCFEIRQSTKETGLIQARLVTIYNILRWVAWTMGQMNRWPRVWCSKYYFFYTFYRLRALKTLYFYFCNFIKKNKKINWKDFCKEFCKKSWKKIILGTSDAWSMIHLSHCPSNPAYYIVNWWIFGRFASRGGSK